MVGRFDVVRFIWVWCGGCMVVSTVQPPQNMSVLLWQWSIGLVTTCLTLIIWDFFVKRKTGR